MVSVVVREKVEEDLGNWRQIGCGHPIEEEPKGEGRTCTGADS